MRRDTVAVGIDVGGTFTDAVMVGPGNELRVTKVITSDDQSVGAAEALTELGRPLAEIRTLVHGTTVATNAILERKGAVVALVTTQGFRDVLEFQRQERKNIWDLFTVKSLPLVPRRFRFEVPERVLASGRVHHALDLDALSRVVDEILARGIEAVAICFLNSYANPVHEERTEAILSTRAPCLYVSASFRVARHFREYERMSTTVLSAYVGPKIHRYLSEFRGRFAERGFDGQILVMSSNGGVLPLERASRLSAATCLSGPAGGVLATLQVARQRRLRNVISFDMGGTSTDVCLISGGEATITTRAEIDGLPITLPMFRIQTVSAGGGSIASVDTGGLLNVGPRSAGARPGPVCYGFGGQLPTVTDALCVMGLLRDRAFFGGKIALDREGAVRAYRSLAEKVGGTMESLAYKTYTVANHKMANAVRLVSVREGHDPRDYTFVAFGGAGPLHACHLAAELGISRVVVPVHPGAFSALGLLCADFQRDWVKTWLQPVSSLADAALRAEFRHLLDAAGPEMAALGAGSRVQWLGEADLRYRGQAYELSILVANLAAASVRDLVARFHARHAAQFGFSEPGSEVELVNLRIRGVVPRPRPRLPRLRRVKPDPARHEPGRVFVRRWLPCVFVPRDVLAPGEQLRGPAVVEEETATTFVPPGWRLGVDPFGHLAIERH